MARVTDREEALAFFKAQTIEVRCVLACRAALRVAASLSKVERSAFNDLVLNSFRALLISAGRGSGPSQDVEILEKAAVAQSAVYFSSSATAAASSPLAKSSAAAAAFFSAAALSARESAASAALSISASASEAAAAAPLEATASSAAYFAFSADTGHVPTNGVNWDSFQNKPVWPSFEGIQHMEATHTAFLKRLAQSPDWNWWRHWYEQMWHGTFTDWDFALEVAKIDWDAPEGESVWDKGPAAVATRIEELQRNRNGEPHFDEARVKDRVRELLKNSNAAASMAESAASLILKGIADYKREAPANGLPDGLELLEELPAHFSQIAEALRRDGPQATREEELEAEIKRLNAKIGKLEAEAAKHRARGAVFREEWVRGMAKTLSDKWFVGGMCFGTAYFFGVDVSDFTLENLRGYISELMEAEPADQQPESPPKPPDV